MRQFKVPGQQPAGSTRFSGGEKKKLLWMAFGLVFVVTAFVISRAKVDSYTGEDGVDLPREEDPMAESVLLPEIDVAALDSIVSDSKPVDRVVLETEAVDLLLADVRTLTRRHFEAMRAEELDGAKVEALAADPSAYRGKSFFARGMVDDLRTRRRENAVGEEFIGRLLLEDESSVYFLTLDAPEAGGFIRVDGLFLKIFSDEDSVNPGEWIEGPLLVGPKVHRSYRSLGEVEAPHFALYSTVEDAYLLGDEPRILRESPFEPLWHMMAFSRDMPEDLIEWQDTQELDNDVLMELLENPEPYRAVPFRIPISRIQDARVLRAGENPARIEHYTQGWIGNTTWKDVVHFKYPVADYDVKLRDYAYGRGFFLHNFAYESSGKGLRVAPVFVLQDLVVFSPEPDPFLVNLGYIVAGLAVLLVVLFFFLVARDKRKSSALQAEIARRRKARRSRRGSVETASP